MNPWRMAKGGGGGHFFKAFCFVVVCVIGGTRRLKIGTSCSIKWRETISNVLFTRDFGFFEKFSVNHKRLMSPEKNEE